MKIAVALLVLLAACPKHDRPNESPPKPDRLLPSDDAAVATLPPAPPLPKLPAGLPQLPHALPTPEDVALGALLFAEPRLSSTAKLACATCHDPAHGFTSAGRPAKADGSPNLRHPLPLVDLAWSADFGEEPGGGYHYVNLDEKIAGHIADQQFPRADSSAHASLAASDQQTAAIDALTKDPSYAPYFVRATGRGASWLRALTAYVATRYEGDSAWDRVERTADVPAALKAGYQLFIGKAQCAVCHTPPLYRDFASHTVAGDAIPTPTLRGAAARAGFLHDGSATTLEAAIDHPVDHAPKLTPAEHAQLVAFVRALSKPGQP